MMGHFLIVFIFLVSSVIYLDAKTLHSALQAESLEDPLKYASVELNGEDYSRLFAGIISKLNETKGQIIDIVPAGLVYDFKLFLPFSLHKNEIKNHENESKLNKNGKDIDRLPVTEEKEEEGIEEEEQSMDSIIRDQTRK